MVQLAVTSTIVLKLLTTKPHNIYDYQNCRKWSLVCFRKHLYWPAAFSFKSWNQAGVAGKSTITYLISVTYKGT